MTGDNEIIEKFMDYIQKPVSGHKYMSFSYRQLIRYFIQWLKEHKLLDLEQLKKDTLSGK